MESVLRAYPSEELMPDEPDVVDDEPIGEDSPAPGSDDDAPDPDAAAGGDDDGDAQADSPDGSDTGDEPDDDGGDAPAAGRSKAFQKLLDKYGGDEEALVNAYFEQANSSARLHQELEELRDYLMNQEDDDDPAEAVAEDPDVKGLNEELTALNQEAEAIQQEQMQLVGQYGSLESEIKVLESQVGKAEDYEKAALKSEIAGKRSELSRVMSQINQGRRELGRVGREAKSLERDLKRAERSVLDRRDQAKKEELRSAQVARLTREEFNVAMREEAKKYGVTVESKQFAILNQSIRNQIHSHLARLPKDAPGIDIGAAVQHLMGEYADAWGMKSSFQKTSTAVRGRTPVTSGPKVKGTPPLPKGITEPKMPKGMQQFDRSGKNWTKEYAQYRAEKLLGR